MYAIVEIAGKQFKLEEGATLFVPHLSQAKDEQVTFDRILMHVDGDDVQVGTPTLQGSTITARILEHVKGDKITVFKKKRRKRYRVKNGHRQQYTQIQIDALNINGSE